MNKSLAALAACLACLPAFDCADAAPARAQDPQQVPDALRRDMEIARQKVYPALVNITVVTRYFQGGRALRAPSAGSGVIITPQGHVLTNFHVAGHSTRITCRLPSGEALDAEVVVHDPLTDLSVLKLKTEKRAATTPLPYASLGDSNKLAVGEYVMAMGNPLSLASSMTLGVASNVSRIFTDFIGSAIENQDLDDGETTGLFTRWIQHDALILPGNSGGPLVNLKGEVIGINELGGNGVGFAIPSAIAADVLRQALEHGKVKRGWLGFSVLPVERLGLKSGALVSSVAPDSPADRAGLKAGDVLEAINDQPVEVRFLEEVPLVYQKVAALEAGKAAALRFTRDGSPKTVTATVAPMEAYRGEEDEVRPMGVTVSDITAPMALQQRLPDKNGVLVTGIRSGYPFEGAKPGVQVGDVILKVDGAPVNDVASFAKAFATKKKEYVIEVRRETESLVSVAKSREDQPDEEGGELPKAWLGVKTQVLTTDVAKALGHAGTKGFRVTQVYPATNAATAGLMPGDIITALNGQKLTAYRDQDADDLKREIEELPIGSKAELTLLRAGNPIKLPVTMQQPPAPAEKAKRATQQEFEFSVRDITDMDRFENRWPRTQQGLLVTEVTNGGWAQMSGLKVEDVILSVNGKSVANVAAFEPRMKELLAAKPRSIQLFVMRGSQTHFVFIEPDWTRLKIATP